MMKRKRMSEKTPYRAENDKKVETHTQDCYNPNSRNMPFPKEP